MLSLLCFSTLLLLFLSADSIKGDQDEDITSEDYLNHVVAYEKNRLGYEKIEDYLQGNVQNELAESNLQAARELLSREIINPNQDERDMPLIAALKQFVNLDWVRSNEHSCNQQSYEILRTLNQATRKRAQKSQSKRGPMRRIELVLADYATEHALRCRNVYPIKFQQVFQGMERSLIYIIDMLMAEMIQSRLRSSSSVLKVVRKSSVLKKIFSSFMHSADSFKTLKDAKICLNHIRELAGRVNQQDLKLLSQPVGGRGDESEVVNNERLQVRELVVKYLLEPCNDYTKQVGPEIFLPALQDSAILEKSDRFKPSVGEQPQSFIYGWTRYGFCFMLQRDQNILVKKIVSLVLD